METPNKKALQRVLRVTNVNIAVFGIIILFYWVWMFLFSLAYFKQYVFASWFIWACFGIGTIFCCQACAGFAAAATRKAILLDYYIIVMFLLLLVESLMTANVLLNDKWDETFPKDRTQRFDEFVDFVEVYYIFFMLLDLIVILTQVTSFTTAVIMRLTKAKLREYPNNYDNYQAIPSFNHHGMQAPPYVVGLPQHATENDVVYCAYSHEMDYDPYTDKTLLANFYSHYRYFV